MDYKKEEIKQHIFDVLNDYSWTEIINFKDDISELHHNLFNTDYYLIGYYNCERWLFDGKLNQTFEVINFIKEYEESKFGEVRTDLSSSESVANMLAYILGEEILFNNDTYNLFTRFHNEYLTEDKKNLLIDSLKGE